MWPYQEPDTLLAQSIMLGVQSQLSFTESVYDNGA